MHKTHIKKREMVRGWLDKINQSGIRKFEVDKVNIIIESKRILNDYDEELFQSLIRKVAISDIIKSVVFTSNGFFVNGRVQSNYEVNKSPSSMFLRRNLSLNKVYSDFGFEKSSCAIKRVDNRYFVLSESPYKKGYCQPLGINIDDDYLTGYISNARLSTTLFWKKYEGLERIFPDKSELNSLALIGKKTIMDALSMEMDSDSNMSLASVFVKAGIRGFDFREVMRYKYESYNILTNGVYGKNTGLSLFVNNCVKGSGVENLNLEYLDNNFDLDNVYFVFYKEKHLLEQFIEVYDEEGIYLESVYFTEDRRGRSEEKASESGRRDYRLFGESHFENLVLNLLPVRILKDFDKTEEALDKANELFQGLPVFFKQRFLMCLANYLFFINIREEKKVWEYGFYNLVEDFIKVISDDLLVEIDVKTIKSMKLSEEDLFDLAKKTDIHHLYFKEEKYFAVNIKSDTLNKEYYICDNMLVSEMH